MSVILSNAVASQALWVILALTVGIWLSVSWVLNYHWKSYGKDMTITRRVRQVYFTGSLILLVSVAILIATL